MSMVSIMRKIGKSNILNSIKNKIMQKQTLVNIILIIVFLGLGGYQLLKKENTVYVDIGKLMQEYQGMKDARIEYDKKATQWQANADTLVGQWQFTQCLISNA